MPSVRLLENAEASLDMAEAMLMIGRVKQAETYIFHATLLLDLTTDQLVSLQKSTLEQQIGYLRYMAR